MVKNQRRQRSFSGLQTRYFSSLKNQITFKLDSDTERAAARFLEFDDNVVSYMAQPGSVKPKPDNPQSRYTFDFGVLLKDGTRELRELKIDSEFDRPSVSQKLDTVDECLLVRYEQKLVRWRYSEINTGFTVANQKRFYNYRRFDLSPYDLAKVGSYLRDVSTLDELMCATSRLNAPPSFPFALIAHKKVAFDFQREFAPYTPVEVLL